ncbi:MAG: hypothetical protein PHX74_08185 [Candidatus Sumerlaeales bacterium]|nr:hypothetical protein [Candidatus Sumerlaeales bacterium]
MEVILTDGFGIKLTAIGMRLYLKKSKLNGFLYEWAEEDDESETCTRMDEGDEYEYGEPNWYYVTSSDLGKHAPREEVEDNLLLDADNFSCTDTILIEVLNEMGRKADRRGCLSIATIPDDIEWYIDGDSEYFCEWVVEGPRPRKWYGKRLE